MGKDDEREDGELDDESAEESAEVYCICRKSDTKRFMIGCDNCEEWYHGDCISITAEYAKKILKFFCLQCREKNNSLQIVFKEKKQPKKKPEPKIEYRDDGPPSGLPYGDSDYVPVSGKRSKYFESDDDEDFYEPEKSKQPRSRPPAKASTSKGKGGRSKGQSTKHGRDSGSKTKRSKQDEVHSRRGRRRGDDRDTQSDLRQCYGPGCTEVARKGSKYCSDGCGLKLAQNRLYEILPNRIRQWQSTPSIADQFSSKELEKIRTEQQDARRILEELDRKQRALDELVAEGNLAQPLNSDEEAEHDEKAEAENELSVHCVSCGHEVSYRFSMRHMEKCFNKYEGQTSYGSIFKTKIDNLFCDVFNPQQNTYCKRLRILCPEHSKDPKIGDLEVCGFPLFTNVFEETGEFCRVLKKKCSKHYCWEKLRRAEIDMERVQQWLRIDDLFEKEQKIKQNMANRGGVLGLMLHQTIVQD